MKFLGSISWCEDCPRDLSSCKWRSPSNHRCPALFNASPTANAMHQSWPFCLLSMPQQLSCCLCIGLLHRSGRCTRPPCCISTGNQTFSLMHTAGSTASPQASSCASSPPPFQTRPSVALPALMGICCSGEHLTGGPVQELGRFLHSMRGRRLSWHHLLL